MIERDYIMRMIAQLAAALSKIADLKKDKKYNEAQQIVQEAYGELFGFPTEMVQQMDAATLGFLLDDKEKIKALASLVHEEGEVLLLQGKLAECAACYQKALDLYQQAWSRPALNRMNGKAEQGSDDAECLAAIRILQAKIANHA
ncbi:MAG: DUF6483 family protein [candidate division KSB1 bacterium]|nr:DUF6483 family protein [candidate division KSB1 bacterium]